MRHESVFLRSLPACFWQTRKQVTCRRGIQSSRFSITAYRAGNPFLLLCLFLLVRVTVSAQEFSLPGMRPNTPTTTSNVIEASGVRFTLGKCERRGTASLTCDFELVALSQDLRVEVLAIYIKDSAGLEQYAESLKVGSELIRGITVHGKAIFAGIEPNAQKLNILTITYQVPRSDNVPVFHRTVSFRDVSIPGALAPIEQPAPSAPGLSQEGHGFIVRTDGCERQSAIVSCRFTITNLHPDAAIEFLGGRMVGTDGIELPNGLFQQGANLGNRSYRIRVGGIEFTGEVSEVSHNSDKYLKANYGRALAGRVVFDGVALSVDRIARLRLTFGRWNSVVSTDSFDIDLRDIPIVVNPHRSGATKKP